jgi:AsmA family protein
MKRPVKITLLVLASLVALVAIALALMAFFNWNRAKPFLVDKMEAATGRSFAINGDLTMKWQRPPHDVTGWRSLIPWPHLRAKNVVLGNPDWATTGPDMARVRQIDFTVSPLALLHKTIAVQSLVLSEPDLVLEQGKGDRANWQFPKQEKKDASDWQFEVRDLGLEQGRVRYVDPAKKADFATEIATLPDGSVKWRSSGHFNKEQLSGHGSAGAILSLQASNVRYPLQADLKIGGTTITVDGTLTNPAHASALDVNLKILGASMADLFPFSGVLLPETPKFSTEGRLAGNLKPGSIRLRYENFKGKVGSSDLGGTLEYAQKQPRAELRGNVVSHYLDLQDLRAVIGSDAPKANASSVKQPPDKILPVSPFKTDRWKTMDVQVQFTGEKIVRSKDLPIDHLLARVRMENGVLSLAPLNFGIAGGRLTTELHIDGRADPAKARMKISARGLKLHEMFPKVESMHASVGQLHGDAALSATGNSIAALLGSSNGELNAVITQGSVSKLILEAMGLNIGGTVAAMLFGDRQVRLNCMVADLGVKDGLMQTRVFTADTSDALIDVKGTIDFASEKLALKIYTDTKGMRLLSLRSPLHLEGTFKNPDIGVDKGQVAAKAGAAAVLGVIAAPVAALLALVQPQSEEKSPCAELMARAEKKPQAPPPGKTAR